MKNQQPTTKQIQWFWEQCGLHKDGNSWHNANGKQLSEEEPPIDLNNLFEYAVPKLREDLFEDAFTRRMWGWIELVLDGDDPAPALFRVIYKALGGEE